MIAHNLGYPRIGPRRELKFALEAYWRGEIDDAELRARGAQLRADNWRIQCEAGLDLVPVGDFAWYDQVLNTTALFGAQPARLRLDRVDLAGYFTMARGAERIPALEMTKWFDTNYHYLVPEFDGSTRFRLDSSWLLDEVREALALGVPAKPVLVGPLTFLWLGKDKQAGFDRLSLLPALTSVYRDLLAELKRLGVDWVQVDEPALVLDLPESWTARLPGIYEALAADGPKLLFATYFGSVAGHAEVLKRLPVGGLHLDLARAPAQLAAFLPGFPRDKVLSLGVVDGRNVWRCDLGRTRDEVAHRPACASTRCWARSMQASSGVRPAAANSASQPARRAASSSMHASRSACG